MTCMFICFGIVLCYAFVFTPWRLWTKFDRVAFDGFAFTAFGVIAVVVSEILQFLHFDFGANFPLVIGWAGLFVIIRALLHALFE